MKKGARVSFQWKSVGGGVNEGTGTVITDEDDGHVQVALDPDVPGETFHYVIWCTVTWLTEIR